VRGDYVPRLLYPSGLAHPDRLTWRFREQKAGLEHDGGQVPDRRFKRVIAPWWQRVTRGTKNF
jgi:hypothetical protein